MWVVKGDRSRRDHNCTGKVVRNICNFSPLDLPHLRELRQRHLFLNKFDLHVASLAVQCWAEWVGRATQVLARGEVMRN